MAESFQDGVVLYKMRNYKDALAVFLSLPSDSQIQSTELAYYVGLSYARLKRYEEALLYLEQVVTGGEDIKRVYQCRLTLAVIYSKTDRPRLADFELQKLVEGGYQTPEVLCALAYTAWVEGKQEDSIALYEQVLEMKSDCSSALNGLGYVLACMDKDLTKALSFCKRAVDKCPDSAAFLDSLGWVYFKLGLLKEAKTYIKRARDKDSKSPEIAEHFAIISTSSQAAKENDRITERSSSR